MYDSFFKNNYEEDRFKFHPMPKNKVCCFWSH